ncbi:MAG: tripartite tricarboxylate transporter substrate-binding protein, partial [Burkholderiales bacterium]|nr:tripartite tricarboxylate transporter substrate-binding protein [Burkholderiales bacterium]
MCIRDRACAGQASWHEFAAAALELAHAAGLLPRVTPPAAIARLSQALAAALAAPKTLERMRELGVEPAPPELASPAGFAAFLREEYERSREAVRLADLKKE